MPLLGGIASFLDKYLLGYALGVAAGPSLQPFVQPLANEAWSIHPELPLEAVNAAQLVADGERDMAWGIAEAVQTGIDEQRFRALVDMIDTAPGVAQLWAMYRRGLIGRDAFRRGVQRSGSIEPEWIDGLEALADVLLSPQEAANAWQQGFMDESAAQAEAGRSGVNAERSAIQRELAGLPPGAMDGLTLLRRGIIDEQTYRQIVREGHTKVKYTDALLALRQQVLSARDAAELWLRGWISEAQAKAIGALTGYDAAAMDLLYLNRGRPATTRQVFHGLLHGARIGPPAGDIEPDFLKAVRNSNIRDEYANLLWAQRWNYPSLFILDRLVQNETLTAARAEEILRVQGYEPQDIAAFRAYWEKPKGGAAHKWTERARGRLFTVTHNEYQDESIDESRARSLLAMIGAGAQEQGEVIDLWNAERGINRLELTPAQIRKAYRSGLYDREAALAYLAERHLSPDDAATLLDS